MTETPLPQEQNSPNVYELMENDNGEIMLLLYAGEEAPKTPSFSLNEKGHMIELIRNKNDVVLIEGLQDETVEKLKKLQLLYVCEINYNENPEAESEIRHAYAAALKKKEPQPAPVATQSQPQKQETLSERVRRARENVLNKVNQNKE